MVSSSRREFIQASSAVGTAAVGVSRRSVSGAATAQSSGGETWPTYQYDGRNTGYAPESVGPVRNTGKRWRDSGEYQHQVSAPAVADGTVYKVREDGVAAYDAETGEQQWHFETTAEFSKGSPTVHDGTVYAPSGEGGVYALDAADGSEEWFFSTTRSDATERSYAVSDVVDGTIYVGGDEVSKTLYAVDAETGNEQWRFEAPVLIRATPAVGDGTVYLGTGRFLIAIDAVDGTEQWRYETGANLTTAPTVADGTVYVGGNFLHHAVDATSGEQLWTTSTDAGNPVADGQAVANGTVYAATGKGLYALDAATGEKQWNSQWEIPGGAGAPAVVGDAVYFVNAATAGENSTPQHLYAVDAETGDELWNFVPEQPQVGGRTPLAVADTTVYTLLGNANLYAIEGDGPESQTTDNATTNDTNQSGESGDGGGFPLLPVAGGGAGLGVLGLLLFFLWRRDEDEEETEGA